MFARQSVGGSWAMACLAAVVFFRWGREKHANLQEQATQILLNYSQLACGGCVISSSVMLMTVEQVKTLALRTIELIYTYVATKYQLM